MAKKSAPPDGTARTETEDDSEAQQGGGAPTGAETPAASEPPANIKPAGGKASKTDRKKGKPNKPKPKNAKAGGKGESKEQRTFPTFTLEEALKVPEAIRQKSKGQPCDTDQVADGCRLSRKTVKFFYLTTASRDYGLTTGTRETPKISLTDLGREIVYAPSPDLERQKKIEAFFKVEKFKQVYDYYNKGGLTKDRYVQNTLENQIRIPTYHHDEFLKVFNDNCKYLGIEEGLGKIPTPSGDGAATAMGVRVLGQPEGKLDKRAFVIMPFSEKGVQKRSNGFFDEVLKSLITPAGTKAGFEVLTARREDSDIIHHTIIMELLNADLVIADLTDHNPNVLCIVDPENWTTA